MIAWQYRQGNSIAMRVGFSQSEGNVTFSCHPIMRVTTEKAIGQVDSGCSGSDEGKRNANSTSSAQSCVLRLGISTKSTWHRGFVHQQAFTDT